MHNSTAPSLIIDLIGTDLSPDEAALLSHPLVTGVILFARNYENFAQLQALCSKIRASRHTPLLIMVDQEGGRVQRFKQAFTLLPSMGQLGQWVGEKIINLSMIEDIGFLMAYELRKAGIDLTLAPILDLNRGLNTVIGDRAFHHDPVKVSELASHFVRGMRAAGMAAVGKHFPGHGGVTLDSHVALPHDERPLIEIESTDLLPFSYFVQNQVAGIMAAHIVFDQVDKMSVCFSRKWLMDILRGQLGFMGTIFSDDLNMAGAHQFDRMSDRVLAAHEAGCDLILVCNNRAGVLETLETFAKFEKMGSQSGENWGRLFPSMLEDGSDSMLLARYERVKAELNHLLSATILG